jgi:LPS sulfotransferase NodH
MLPTKVSAMATRFEAFYDRRKGGYTKDAGDERFIRELNEYLEPRERELYGDAEITAPFVFVLGLPRSGTTLLSQLLAYCLDVGYIDNVTARFWLAPVHGLRLSRGLLGRETLRPAFESDYARTSDLRGIHEFGYFWRHWLRKESFADVAHARDREDEIDWAGLRHTLANMQEELGGRPFTAKNVLASYHLPRLRAELGQVVYVYVERDPLDVAVSILDARRKYYSDPNTWWSYMPPEVEELAGLDHWEQIAGQVHYLARFFERALPEAGEDVVVRTTYEALCRDPRGVLDEVTGRSREAHGAEIGVTADPPATFPFRTHADRSEEKERFRVLLARLAAT